MIIRLIGVLLAMLIIHLLTPFWWTILVVPFMLGVFFPHGSWSTIGAGAIGAALLWSLGALYYWINGGTIIADRIAVMAGLPHPWLLIAATTLVGLLSGGLAAGAGYFLRRALIKN